MPTAEKFEEINKHFDLRNTQVTFKLITLSSCVAFTERFPSFDKETLPLQILLAQTAVEALGVVVVVESLHPPVSRLYWEPTRYALGGKQLIPVFFAIGKSVLQVKRGVCKYFPTVGTDEALRMEVGAHGFQAVLLFHF